MCSGLTSLSDRAGIIIVLMRSTSEQIAAVRCPTCGAAPGEKCELNSGQLRFEPHQPRRFNAADKIEGQSRYARENERSLQKLLVRLEDARNGKRE
jgi:hypothetical protein